MYINNHHTPLHRTPYFYQVCREGLMELRKHERGLFHEHKSHRFSYKGLHMVLSQYQLYQTRFVEMLLSLVLIVLVIVICLPTEHLGVVKNSLTRVHAF